MVKIACFLEEWINEISHITKNISEMYSKIINVSTNYKTVEDNFSLLQRYFFHMHFFHLHPIDHNVKQNSEVCDSVRVFNYPIALLHNNILENQVTNLPLYLGILNKEFLYNQDFDDNNMIYGKDFRLHDFDPMKTNQLFTLEYLSDFSETIQKNNNFITFYEYLQTIDKDRNQVDLHNARTLYHLFHELIRNEDVDDNDMIYGKDFRIPYDDPLKERKLTNAEYYVIHMENKTLSNNYINYQEYLQEINSDIQRQHFGWIEEENICSVFLTELRTGLSIVPMYFEIYGKTYVIPDSEKPMYLKKIEDLMFNSSYYRHPLRTKSIDITRSEMTGYQYKYFSPYSGEIFSSDTFYQTLRDKYIEAEQDSCSYYCARLIGEWNYETDLDDNGMIYGIDFLFSDDDPNKTDLLKKIEYNIKWYDYDTTSRVILSYDDYINTLPFDDVLSKET